MALRALTGLRRLCSTAAKVATTAAEQPAYPLLERDLNDLYRDMREKLAEGVADERLLKISTYYFLHRDKWTFVPQVALLMGRAVNRHLGEEGLHELQREVVMVAEMIINGSLIYDDVLEGSHMRKGAPAINTLWGSKECMLAANMVLVVTNRMLIELKNPRVALLLNRTISDLVVGEFMQWSADGAQPPSLEQLHRQYLEKSFRKFASPPAHVAQAVAMLAGADDELVRTAYRLGRSLGMAFQLMDDLLDLLSTPEQLGKPTGMDLRQGLATAPVLFAAQQRPELMPLILRRFAREGDVAKALELLHRSDGIARAKDLASGYVREFDDLLRTLADSPYRTSLRHMGVSILQHLE